MSRLVVDASMTLSWLLPDESSASALTVRKEILTAESVWVPAHWRLEVCNSLWMAEPAAAGYLQETWSSAPSQEITERIIGGPVWAIFLL